jgi:GNAT superfamily N-acetyltransferase
MFDAASIEVSRMAGSADLADVTDRLLAMLPSWFGVEAANAAYVRSARHLPGLVARINSQVVGVLLHRRHFPEAAEIELVAVDPSWHRRGVGTALVSAVATHLRLNGCRLVQVKTLGPSHPHHGYALTRAFYTAVGFLPVEETDSLWPGNPCLIMIRCLADHAEG